MPRAKNSKKVTAVVGMSPTSVAKSDSELSSALASAAEQSACDSDADSNSSFNDDTVKMTRSRKRKEIAMDLVQKKSGTKLAKLGSPTGDSEAVYCLCRKPYDNRFMIECDRCHEWYHGDCIGISLRQGKQMEKRNEDYICDACKGVKNDAEISYNIEEEEDGDEHISLAAIREQVVIKQPINEELTNNEQEESEHASNDEMSDVKRSDILSKLQQEIKDFKGSSGNGGSIFSNIRSSLLSEAAKTDVQPSPYDFVDEANEPPAEVPLPVKVDEAKEEPAEKKPRTPENPKGPKVIKSAGSVAVIANFTSNTPPASNSPLAPPKRLKEQSSVDPNRCFVGGCENRPMANSIYCSPECLRSHCQQSVEVMRTVHQARLQKNSNNPDSQLSELQLSVIDAKSGRLITEHKLVNERTIEKFISRHPTFRIVTPQATPSMLMPQPPLPPPSSSTSSSQGSPTSGVHAFRLTVRTELRDALKARVEGADDVMFTTAEINRAALRIEEAMFKHLGGSQSDKYKQRFRSLILNLKDSKNKGLFRRILSGSFSPEELATLPAERLASDELVQWREQQRKKSLELLIGEAQPIISSTTSSAPSTKPVITAASLNTTQSTNTAPPVPTLTHADLSSLETFSIDTTKNHREHLFDVNCRICTGKPESSVAASQPRPSTVVPLPASKAPLPSSYASLANESYNTSSSDLKDIMTFEPASGRTAASASAYSAPKSPVYNASTTTTSVLTKPVLSWRPPSSARDDSFKGPDSQLSPIIASPPRPQIEVEWFGDLKPDTAAPNVPISGRLISVTPNAHLERFPEVLEVIGKLTTPSVWDYLDKVRRSGNKEILVVLLEPTKSPDSVTNYRSCLASLKERSRYAVVRTVHSQVHGGYKDIYLTYSNTDWLRRLTGYGMKFTEQLPLESKLACVFVRYTGPVSTVPTQASSVGPSQAVNIIPLGSDGKSSSKSPVSTERKSDPTKTPVDDDDEDYDPNNFLISAKSLKPSLEKSSTVCVPADSSPAEPTASLAKQVQKSPTGAEDKSKKAAPAVLSTPEEVSSVSELIRRILGSSAPAMSTSTSLPTSSSTSTKIAPLGPSTVISTAEDQTVKEPVASSNKKADDASFSAPSFPPPPPGFFPSALPPGAPPVPSGVLMPPGAPFPSGMPMPPGFPMPPGPPMPPFFSQMPAFPPNAPTLHAQKRPLLPNPQAESYAEATALKMPPNNNELQKPIPPPPMPPPPMFFQAHPGGPIPMMPPPQPPMLPPPGMPLFPPADFASQAPPANFSSEPPYNRGPPDIRAVNENERLIWRYLSQLLDENLSLNVRSNLLQELATLLQNPVNEDIVKQNPELTSRFQRAVAIVNSVSERNNKPGIGMPKIGLMALVPPQLQAKFSSEEANQFLKKTAKPLLPTPDAPPLNPDALGRNLGPQGGFNGQQFQPDDRAGSSFMTPMSDWRRLLHAYRERVKASSSSSSAQSSYSRSSESYGRQKDSWNNMGIQENDRHENDGQPAKRRRPSRFGADDAVGDSRRSHPAKRQPDEWRFQNDSRNNYEGFPPNNAGADVRSFEPPRPGDADRLTPLEQFVSDARRKAGSSDNEAANNTKSRRYFESSGGGDDQRPRWTGEPDRRNDYGPPSLPVGPMAGGRQDLDQPRSDYNAMRAHPGAEDSYPQYAAVKFSFNSNNGNRHDAVQAPSYPPYPRMPNPDHSVQHLYSMGPDGGEWRGRRFDNGSGSVDSYSQHVGANGQQLMSRTIHNSGRGRGGAAGRGTNEHNQPRRRGGGPMRGRGFPNGQGGNFPATDSRQQDYNNYDNQFIQRY